MWPRPTAAAATVAVRGSLVGCHRLLRIGLQFDALHSFAAEQYITPTDGYVRLLEGLLAVSELSE